MESSGATSSAFITDTLAVATFMSCAVGMVFGAFVRFVRNYFKGADLPTITKDLAINDAIRGATIYPFAYLMVAACFPNYLDASHGIENNKAVLVIAAFVGIAHSISGFFSNQSPD